MPSNTRFSVAMHVLTLLAMQNGTPVTSEYVAGSVRTNPVVIRRILGMLREAGFVTAVQGPGGGFTLAVDPKAVTLRDVYEAVESRDVIAIHSDANPLCPVGRNIATLLDEVTADAEKAMLDSLSNHTLTSLLRRIARREAT